MSGMIASSLVGGIFSNKAANQAADAQDRATAANAAQTKLASDQYNDYKALYQPLEQKMVGTAADYDNPGNRNAAASAAQADVSSELGKAQQRLNRTVGYDPSSAAAQAAQANLALSGAALGATAQNTARQKVQDTAYAHQLDMLGMGKGLVANAATGLANAASNSGRLALSSQQMANDQAGAAGKVAGGLIGGLQKVDWSNLGGKFGFGGGGVASNADYANNDYLTS
jgi:hypothetical protein